MPDTACLHIQGRESDAVRLVDLRGSSFRIGRAAYWRRPALTIRGILGRGLRRLRRRGESWLLSPRGSQTRRSGSRTARRSSAALSLIAVGIAVLPGRILAHDPGPSQSPSRFPGAGSSLSRGRRDLSATASPVDARSESRSRRERGACHGHRAGWRLGDRSAAIGSTTDEPGSQTLGDSLESRGPEAPRLGRERQDEGIRAAPYSSTPSEAPSSSSAVLVAIAASSQA